MFLRCCGALAPLSVSGEPGRPDQGHKGHGTKIVLRQSVQGLAHAHKPLQPGAVAHRHDQTPAGRQLRNQSLRHIGARGGDKDDVKGAAIGPALQGAPALLPAVDRNIAVWERVEHQLVEIREGRRTVLEFPAALPEPAYSADYLRDRPAGHRRLLQYYGLPENTPVVLVPR